MPQQNVSLHETPSSVRLLTTVLAGGWGLSSAYILFEALLVTHDWRACFAALVPLVAVWATLERKRWGRLALLGLSATALGLFVAAIGFVAALGYHTLEPGAQNLANYAQIALRLYADCPGATLTILLLAAATGIWLRLPAATAEFERGKRATLAVAQRGIAFCLVGCWGLTLVFASQKPAPLNIPLLNTEVRGSSQSHGASKASHSRKHSSQPNRSAVSPNNL